MDRFELIKNELKKAKSIDPESYLISKGYAVKKEGRHYSVRINDEEVYRTTRLDDGTYVTCDKFSNGIGDNISLVKNLEGCSFKDAISILNKTSYVNNISEINQKNNQISNQEKKEEIKLPKSDINIVNNGRKYLLERGIDLEIILKAEKQNFIKYANDSVFFVGYNSEGKINNVTKRSTNTLDEVQKRDLKGSDKFYPQVLKGSEKSIWIVEGGVDALAAHALAARLNKEAPTVVVTGGANVLAPFKNLEIQELLKRAEKVVVIHENEKNLQVQETTNKAHLKQIEYINNVSSNKSICWKPPQGYKDLADYNFKLRQENKINNNTEQIKQNLLKQKPKLKM